MERTTKPKLRAFRGTQNCGGVRFQASWLQPEVLDDLRHSAATLLLGLGVHPKVVQELLGHSQIGMTLDVYSHVLPTMQKEAMERLTKALEDEQ